MKVGLALGGGLSKGSYQFGFIKALLEYIPYEDIKIVSASSIGLFNAYGLCTKKLDDVENIWLNTDFDNIFEVIRSCWFHHEIRNNLKKIMDESDTLKIPFYTSISYLPMMGRYYLIENDYNKKWLNFFRAAIGFPVVTGWPKFYKGLLTMDGGAFDNIPIYPLIENHDLDLIICIHFDSRYSIKKEWKNKNTIILDLDCALGNNLRKYSFNFSHEILKGMMESGYSYGKKIMKELFLNGYDLENVKINAKRIHDNELNERLNNGSIDRLVTLLNAVYQIFRTKRSIKPFAKGKTK